MSDEDKTRSRPGRLYHVTRVTDILEIMKRESEMNSRSAQPAAGPGAGVCQYTSLDHVLEENCFRLGLKQSDVEST